MRGTDPFCRFISNLTRDGGGVNFRGPNGLAYRRPFTHRSAVPPLPEGEGFSLQEFRPSPGGRGWREAPDEGSARPGTVFVKSGTERYANTALPGVPATPRRTRKARSHPARSTSE
jgi:hypothetical protein